MKKLYALLAFYAVFQAPAQQYEQVTIMTYNLLNYRLTTSYCTGANNSASAKEGYLKTITQYVDPDLLVCNEIGSNPANADDILTKVLNVDGVTHYSQASYTNNSFSSLVNMLFYNHNKFGLHSQYTVTHDLSNNALVRVIDLYRLYYKDPLLGTGGDTVYFTVVAAHLKAGDATSDEQDRADATEALMDYLENYPDDDVILCGDLNMKTALEDGFQNLVNWSDASERFFDPVNALGNWNNNGVYADYHTQSTRTTNTNSGCFSGGGMDDRFDVILLSDEVLNGTGPVHYVSGTYEALGNNGNLLNQPVNASNNFSVPANVLTALYEMSDHLPVRLYLEIQKLGLGSDETNLQQASIRLPNPVNERLRLEISGHGNRPVKAELLDLTGKTVRRWEIGANGILDQPVSGLRAGLYLIKLTNTSGSQRVLKIVKQ